MWSHEAGVHDPSLPEEVRGIDGVRELVETYRSGIAGLGVTIDHQIADGDYVAGRYTCRGTHEGDFMGLPATGRGVTIAGLVISRFRDGKVVEEWEVGRLRTDAADRGGPRDAQS
jgi:predicted ester cyclase